MPENNYPGGSLHCNSLPKYKYPCEKNMMNNLF
jgi:hypothetical protein